MQTRSSSSREWQVYRIVASILDESGTLSAKITEVKSGKVTYKIDVGTGTPLELDEDCVIVRNGTSATFADLKAGDSLEWAYDTDDALVTYIDAFSNVLEGYTLVSLRSTSAGTVATLEKDGVESCTPSPKDQLQDKLPDGGVAVSALDVDTIRRHAHRSGPYRVPSLLYHLRRRHRWETCLRLWRVHVWLLPAAGSTTLSSAMAPLSSCTMSSRPDTHHRNVFVNGIAGTMAGAET
jgi:hypothetical protein